MRPVDQHINLPQRITRKGFQTIYRLVKTYAKPSQNLFFAKLPTQFFLSSFLPFLIFSCLLLLASASLHAQEERSLTRDGNKQFDKQKYADAEASYKKALETKNNFPEAVFNLGDAMYKQGRWDDAAKQFQLASKLLTDSLMKARAFHNLGNCSMEKKEYEEAVKAYKQALRINPADRDTKYNLAYANAKLKDNSQNNQNKNDQNKQDKNKKDDKKDQDKKNGDKKDQDKNDKDKKDQQGKGDKDKKDPKDSKDKDGQGDKKDQQSKKYGGTMTKEQADKLLEALKAEEQKTQEKMQKKTAKPQEVKVEKDW